MRWWTVYSEEVERNFTGECWTCADRLRGVINHVEAVDEPGLGTKPGRIHTGLNSGYQAINLAYMWGAARIILLGYDMQRGPKGESHHHGDHEGNLPNLGTMPEWGRRMVQLGADLRSHGVEVVNATRRTAITCFERLPIEEALAPGKQALLLHGMHGLGDNLHERALVRELMKSNEVWLTTSWPQVFWDMPRLHLVPKKSRICWMAKNEVRAAALYGATQPPRGARTIENGYLSMMPRGVKDCGSVLGVMAHVCGVPVGDFRMPIKPEWKAKADALLAKLKPTKPLLIYRPPVAISDQNNGSARAKVARNPDLAASHALIAGIRDRYFVISLADLMDGIEWLIGPQIKADAEFHRGELDFETIAALTAAANLVFCSPGFALVLAQAVSTPVIAIFGGFEDARSFSAGARYSPWCAIEPVKPCACWSHGCNHDKAIDVPAARERIAKFIEETCKH